MIEKGVNCNLRLEHHIKEKKYLKANQMVRIIRRSFEYLDIETYTKLVKAIVRWRG